MYHCNVFNPIRNLSSSTGSTVTCTSTALPAVYISKFRAAFTGRRSRDATAGQCGRGLGGAGGGWTQEPAAPVSTQTRTDRADLARRCR
ncbi:hypothetical protein HO173_006787 [Letharia columbiana]|uniref:Uncharacterized protein n=1 Tax=Letharia columbiana TaxID=112416 RepID=A0A8H6FUU6_9LECA|nr:uncharacterized protein HO173_006787 [Letharia columbiana]KAF6235158.1 hypothetical protein HO173_006787 [Letharia columbiana]